MAKYAITPWRHHRDLLAVRQQLYGDSEQRNAVDRVMAWKLRGNLPHAVESTALLVDAILHHSIEGKCRLYSTKHEFQPHSCTPT